jgi:glutamine synthetase
MRASFAPLLDPAQAGNGVHIHLNLLDAAGRSMLYDGGRPACLSEFGGRFAAGILKHARALSALTAPSPTSAMRLQPHRWSAGAVCLAERNREALLRIPPLVSLDGGDPARQLHLEYRGADAAANPYLALAAVIRAGLDGVRSELPTPPILDRDPAQLDDAEAERYGVAALPASLGDALKALAEDEVARGWMSPLLYDAYLSVKQAELGATADLDLSELCTRYAAIY